MALEKTKEEKRFIPLHFQTFGDMMMNILILFILLCSFAREKHAAFFEAGRGSFIVAIESLGLPGILPSDDSAIQLDVNNQKHRGPMAPESEIKAGEERANDSVEDIDLEEVLVREIIIEGVLAIQAGDQPQLVEEKLKSFLSPQLRRELEAKTA